MAKTSWKFIEQSSPSNLTFDESLEQFFKLGIDGLIRENIQNALDAKLTNNSLPVEVKINTGTINKNVIPDIDNLSKHIYSLCGQNQYSKEVIDNMHSCLKKENVDYLSFEDFNTEGLSGIPNKNNLNTKGTWMAYAYHKGYHFVKEENKLENLRGGSHGIGKIASNSASDLHMFFFANCDESGNQHIGGRINLIDHIYNNIAFSNIGYFTNVKKEKTIDQYYPPINNFDNIFKKDTRGLKIIIPYLRSNYKNENNIIKSICNNFFIAILKNQLVVSVNDNLIDSTTIENIIDNKQIYNETKTNNSDYYTPLYLKTYLSPTISEPINIYDKNENKYPFNLYFQYDENIKEGRTAIIRSIGMKIEDRKIKNNIKRPYNAILIPQSDECDVFLKSLENASHTKLETNHFRDDNLTKNAKRFLKDIDIKLEKIIRDFSRDQNLNEGKLNTDDLIYSINSSFKKQISKNYKSIELNSGDKNTPKTLNKIKTNPKKHKKPEKPSEEDNSLKNIFKKLRKTDPSGKNHKRNKYTLNTESIYRIALENEEILKFDLSLVKGYKNQTICDMSLYQIDGEGVSNKYSYDLDTNYTNIIDLNSSKNLSIEHNIIKNIKIQKGIINLKLTFDSNYNKSSKFLYNVEV